jgi:hypothetical protein
MGLLDRSEVRTIPLHEGFYLKNAFFKMSSVRVRFSPGWLSGEGFSAEQLTLAISVQSGSGGSATK